MRRLWFLLALFLVAPSAARAQGLEITFTGVPASPTNLTAFEIGFSAPGAVGYQCELPPNPPAACTSPFTLPTLADGPHELRVTATGPAGETGTGVARVTIDTVAPAAVTAARSDTTFTFAGEPGATFECRLEGVDAAAAACTSPRAYGALAPGDYRFTLVTIDAAGNRSAATAQAFSVAPPPAALPPPPVVVPPPLILPAAPAAALGRRVVVRTTTGRILVNAALLATSTAVPVGTEIDARAGRLRLTAEGGRGRPLLRLDVSGGLFRVTQAADGFVMLTLTGTPPTCRNHVSRGLTADGKGRFRIKGRYATATARGTKFLVRDSCEGTLTRVAVGVVSVRDIRRGKSVLLRAGRRYLAAR